MASLLPLILFAAIFSVAFASDSSPLQDFCVADLSSSVFVNGFVCKNPALVQASDFFFDGLRQPGDTSNEVGSVVTFAVVTEFPGLNTLGVAMARIDFAPWGLNPPHNHPRASEILIVIEGTLLAGLITSNPDHRLFTKILHKGDIFVFPEGLLHFQQNVGNEHAVAHASFNSQNPGVVTIANATFGSHPDIPSEILAKAFQVNVDVIKQIQAEF